MLALAMHDNRGFADLALAMCKPPHMSTAMPSPPTSTCG